MTSKYYQDVVKITQNNPVWISLWRFLKSFSYPSISNIKFVWECFNFSLFLINFPSDILGGIIMRFLSYLFLPVRYSTPPPSALRTQGYFAPNNDLLVCTYISTFLLYITYGAPKGKAWWRDSTYFIVWKRKVAWTWILGNFWA